MTGSTKTFPELVREVRRQLGISQEELAHELGVSFATINRWENGKTTPFKLARGHFDSFCKKMTAAKKLDLTEWVEG
jgi:transcriptional regulator with XRE-family HTH domain